jgi:CheY-like chemotaxis protein
VQLNNRILIVDDSQWIHDDFKKILPFADGTDCDIDELLDNIFEDDDGIDSKTAAGAAGAAGSVYYELYHAYQGEQAYEMVEKAARDNRPFAVAFIDVRMPPGWDGIETIQRIWAKFPDLEIVICTAYSDYSWEEILQTLGVTDQLQFLRKPFDVISIKQMALALTKKWTLARKLKSDVDDLEANVNKRTSELAEKIRELEAAMSEILQLQEIIPMCAYCQKVRDDEGFWHRVDRYLQSHTPSSVSHGVCPGCYDKLVAPLPDDTDTQSG